jgi:iron(III) transport system substrate-binding protein
MQRFGANDARPFFGNSQIRNLVAAGELAFGIYIYLDNVLTMQKQGAPIALWNADPVGYAPSVNAIMAKAPHPEAAKLFTEWQLDAAVQALLADEQLVVPVRGDVPNPHPEYFQDIKYAVVGPDEADPHLDRQRKDFEQFFRVPPAPAN